MNVLKKTDEICNKVWPEERLVELFRILRQLCLKYIKATHLLTNLPFLRQHASKITKAERKSSSEATELLFKLIADCDEPDRWQKFTVSLKKAEFLSLYKVCHFCENDDFDFYMEIFDLLSLDFAENGVDIKKLSEAMLSLESLTEKQFQQINKVLNEEGETAAILEFISCKPSSLEKWVKALVSSLYSVNKINLCKLIQKKDSEIHIYHGIDLECLVRMYSNKIIERVRPQDIKLFLRTYDLIADMNLKCTSPIEEMQGILLYIENSKVLGKWRSFVNALKEAGYESLYNKLANKGTNTDDSQDVQSIKVMQPGIVDSIDMNRELLLQIKTELINERCYQEIEKKQKESGNIAAAEMLLENIYRFKDGWYKTFLRILIWNGQSGLVKKINFDFPCFQKESDICEDEAMKVTLPDASKKTELKTSINLTIDEELLQGAYCRKNCIIYISTRRNVVALTIIKMHLDIHKKNKVVFLGSSTSVELQKYLLDTNLTNCQVFNFTTDSSNSLEHELMRNQVVLLSPLALKNSGLEKLLSNFSLLLIDECHLTIEDHPYNNVMKSYIEHKLNVSSVSLPQIIGLTSLSHENPQNISQANDQIKMICANLDCEELCSLQDDTNYIACYSKTIPFNQSDYKNPFKEKVEEIMSETKNHLKSFEVSTVIKKENSKLLETLNICINNYDGSFYTDWLDDLSKGFDLLNDYKINLHCKCCLWFLNMLHNALEISIFCEIKNAFDYIEHELLHYVPESEIYETLKSYWEDKKHDMKILIEKPKYFNHQLELLKNAIQEEIKNNPWSKIVVFVKTPILVSAILNWMLDVEDLKLLLPYNLKKLIDSRSDVYKDMLETFDRRECQLCVAIPKDLNKIHPKYNLRLDYFDSNNEMSQLPNEGMFNDKAAHVEEVSLLHKAMKNWKQYATEDNEEFQHEITKYQRNAKCKHTNT